MPPGSVVQGVPGILLDLPEAEIWLFERFLDNDEARGLFEVLVATTPWCQEAIRMFGKEVQQPQPDLPSRDFAFEMKMPAPRIRLAVRNTWIQGLRSVAWTLRVATGAEESERVA